MSATIQETLATLSLDIGMTHKSSPSQTLEVLTALLIKRVAELESKDEHKIRIALNKKLATILTEKTKDDLLKMAPSYYSSKAIENFNKLTGRVEDGSTPESIKPTIVNPLDIKDFTLVKPQTLIKFSICVSGKQYRLTKVYASNSDFLEYKLCYNKTHMHIENLLESDVELIVDHPSIGKTQMPVSDLSWISLYSA